ncbi:MAG: alpha/beta hydrolase [Acidimicrobiales bacterium]|jgi:pimeloyl-ACP methyl ester carboxylesterase|nr:alpha/beta hydrolase [Acidimicrobiales bacterium]
METTSRGFRIHYETRGAGTPLLLVPGHLHSVHDLIDLAYVDMLADDFRVVAVDPLGYGSSDKPHDPAAYAPALVAEDLVAVLDAEGIDRAHVWGYSRGGWLVEHLARLHPDRVRAVVIGGNLPGLTAEERRSTDRPELRSLLTDGDWDGYFDRWMPTLPPDARAALAVGNDPVAVAAALEGLTLGSPAEDLPLDAPLLCYVGTDEPWWELARDRVSAQGGRFLPVERADHVGAFRRSTDVLLAVVPFLDAVDRGRA